MSCDMHRSGATRFRVAKVFGKLVSLEPHTIKALGLDESLQAIEITTSDPQPRPKRRQRRANLGVDSSGGDESDEDVDWTALRGNGGNPRTSERQAGHAEGRQAGSGPCNEEDNGNFEELVQEGDDWLASELEALVGQGQEHLGQIEHLLNEASAADELEAHDVGGVDDDDAAPLLGAPAELAPSSVALEAAGPAAELEALVAPLGQQGPPPADQPQADQVQPQPLAAREPGEGQGGLLPLSDALSLDIGTLDRLCLALGVQVTPAWHIVPARPDVQLPATARGKLGVIHCMWGRCLECTCSLHTKCTLLLNSEGVYRQAELQLVKWACSGFGVTADAHRESAAAIRLTGGGGGAGG